MYADSTKDLFIGIKNNKGTDSTFQPRLTITTLYYYHCELFLNINIYPLFDFLKT